MKTLDELITEQTKASVYREAGWATVAILIGLPAQPADHCSASTRIALSRSPSRPSNPGFLTRRWVLMDQDAQLRVEARAIAILAGGLAEAKAFKDNSPALRCVWDCTRVIDALTHSQYTSMERARELMGKWAKQARAILDNPGVWATVERVASALEKRGQLTAYEVHNLVQGVETPAG